MAKKHVVIGGGPAGMHAIETIRKYETAADSEIHLVSSETPYSRMVIPYWMAGQISEDHVLTSSESYYKQDGVTAHIGQRVVEVNTSANSVKLEGGSSLDFDNLLICTGSGAIKPPIEGVDLPGVHNLWTMEDAQAVLNRTTQASKVLFIGAGFIGFIVLNALYKRGNQLAVVEAESHVLPRMLDADAAGLVEKWLQGLGIETYTSTRVQQIQQSGDQLKAVFEDGHSVEADCVVVATGIRPHIDFLENSGIETDQAILVDDHLRTNVSNVYAAGDCAQGPDLSSGNQEVHAIQPTAIDHGRVAGANMAGQDVSYRGSLLMNVLDVCGLQCASFGQWNAGEGAETFQVVNEARPVYRKMIWEEDRLVGTILLGQTNDVSSLNDMGMLKGFIQTGTPFGMWKDHIRKNILDIRRPYIACKVAEQLLNQTILPEPTEDLGYRHNNDQPKNDPGPHHGVFVNTIAGTPKDIEPTSDDG